MTRLRNSGSRLARLVGVAVLAALGLCVLMPAHAQAQTEEWTQRPGLSGQRSWFDPRGLQPIRRP